MTRIHPQTLFILIGVAAILLIALFAIPVPSQDASFRARLAGTIVLDQANMGAAWYILPDASGRIALGRPNEALPILQSHGYDIATPADALRIMAEESIGITAEDLARIPLAESAH